MAAAKGWGRWDEHHVVLDAAHREAIERFAHIKGFAFEPRVGAGAAIEMRRTSGRDHVLLRVKGPLIGEGPYSRWKREQADEFRRSRSLAALHAPRTLHAAATADPGHPAGSLRDKRCLLISPAKSKALGDARQILHQEGLPESRLVVACAQLQGSPATVAAAIRDALASAPAPTALHYQTGNIPILDGQATLNTSTNLRYLNAQEARSVIVNDWGNPPDTATGVQGLIVPVGQDLSSQDSWAVVVTEAEEDMSRTTTPPKSTTTSY